jgi:hypothetical protein
MSRRLRTACCLGMSLAWIGWTASVAGSEPPQRCRDLALQFGTAPAQMDANALAALRNCEMDEIQERSGPSQPAQAPPQSDASESAPAGQSGWGQWPSPPQWSDGQGKSRPWGDHIPE